MYLDPELDQMQKVKIHSTLPPSDTKADLVFPRSLFYLRAQAFSTSAMVFGASEDRMSGPPLSLITTSSSILTPSPQKRSGTCSLSLPMYNPAKSRKCMTLQRKKMAAEINHPELTKTIIQPYLALW